MENVNDQIQKLKSQTESIVQLVDLGDVYLQKNDKLEARHYYQMAIEKYPQDPSGHAKMGAFTLLNGEAEEANSFYAQAVRLDSSNAENWLGYAKTHLSLNGLTRAEEYIEKALNLKPEDIEILFYAGVVKLQLHNLFYARKYLEQAVKDRNYKLYGKVKFYMSVLNAMQGRFDKALEDLGAIKDIADFNSINHPNGFAYQNNLAMVKLQLGNAETATSILKNIAENSSIKKASTWTNLGIVYWTQDKIPEATEAFEKAHSLDSEAWPWISELKDYVATGAEGLAKKLDGLMKENPDGQNIGIYLGCVIPNRFPFIDVATRHVLNAFKIGVKELEGAGCCPAPGVFRSFDIETWLTLAARNITISEDMNRDLMTMCNGCYGTLNDVNTELIHDKVKRDTVNSHLKKVGKEFKGSVAVKHILDVLYNDIGPKEIKKRIVHQFKGLKVAVHYGCHLLKPTHNKPWAESFEVPSFFDEIVELTGAKSVPYKEKLMCCGAGGGVRGSEKEISLDFTREKLENMRDAGIDIIVVCCPFCHLQFDLGQMEVSSIFKDQISGSFKYPVVYITQLLGLAMGLDPYVLGVLKTPKTKGLPPFNPMEPMFTKLIKKLE
jgi:heterodisulfide reductase subunit B2